VVVNVFLTSTTVVLNHFAEGSRIQTYDFVGEPHKKNYLKSIDMFCFVALTKILLHKLLEVLLIDTTYRKESFHSKNQTLSSYIVYISPTK